MSNTESPIELIIAAFQDERGAEQALDELKAAKKEKLIGIQAAVVMRRDEKGKLHTKDVKLTPGKGAARGAGLGVILGVVTGGAALALGAGGAAIGALIGKRKKNKRFSPERLDQVADALEPGTSALVAVIEHTWVEELSDELAEAGADVMTAAIAADIAEQLAAGHDVSYSALSDDDSLTTSRLATGEDEIQASSTTFTDESIEHSAAVVTEESMSAKHVVITEEGVAAEGVAITDDAVEYAAGVITDDVAAAKHVVITEEGVAAEGIAVTDDVVAYAAGVLTDEDVEGAEDNGEEGKPSEA